MHIVIVVSFLVFYCKSYALRLEKCNASAIGMENRDIPDAQILASSSFDKQSVGPQNARLHSETASGAWCPKPQINSKSYEYLQINLNHTYLITGIETQGRYGNGTGREFASEYMIDYMRPGSQWIRYKNRTGHTLMMGNFDTTTPVNRELDPPIVATKIRIVPTSKSTRTVCLRAELHGCHHDGVIYYSTVPDGSRLENWDFKDSIFEDSQLYTESGIPRGLGLLTDGYISQQSPFDQQNDKNARWIGWNRETTDGQIMILFEFAESHNFTDVVLATFGNRIDAVDVIFSQDGKNFPLYSQISSSERQSQNTTNRRYNFKIPLHNRCGKKVRLTIKFSSDWIFLTEVHFTSAVNQTSGVIKNAKKASPVLQQFLVICGVLFLAIFTCVVYSITVFIRKRRSKESKCDKDMRKDLIITHMGNKPSCHVFPTNTKINNCPYEVANDIYYAKSQKSTLLSVSSKSSSTYRQIPPTWNDFNFPPPPTDIKEEHIYSQPVSPETSNSGSFKSIRKGFSQLKKYPSSALMIGSEIGEGKFTILKECIVFGGIKVVHKSTKGPQCIHGRSALKDEIDMLMKCGKHPKIVELIAIDEHNNLLLEYMELGSINRFLKSSSMTLDSELLTLICRDVCMGLEHLENIGIVHGHFSPNNILINEDFRVKICSPRGPSIYAQLRYSAPESIIMNQFTHKSDVWSYAASVWELCYHCSSIPFEELTHQQIIDNAMNLIENSPDAKVLEFPPVLNFEILRLLNLTFSSNPIQRPSFKTFLTVF